MKKLMCALLLACFIIVNAAYSYTYWQTTKNFYQYGPCQLESNSIKVIVHKYHIDVEEDAKITTAGNVSRGDPNTLEIVGTFRLSPGACMRSLLLWNGNHILKAKLIDREKADSIMDSIVNYTYRDPALIKHEGNNNYSFRIYPVSIGNSRKIRVLYSIPLQSYGENLQFQIQPAFTLGPQYVPTQIPVTIVNTGDTLQSQFLLQYKKTKKALQFGATYLIPFESFHRNNYYDPYGATPEPVRIIPDTTNITKKAFSCEISSPHKATGFYHAVFTKVPYELSSQIKNKNLTNYTIEVSIVTNDQTFIRDIPQNRAFTIYLKSRTVWNNRLNWRVYNENGTTEIEYLQHFDVVDESPPTSTLPLLWGAKYSLVEGLGNMGGLFGFIDNKMSLLALERDTLPFDIAQRYQENGVPLLFPNEIITDTSKIDVPKENVIFDMNDMTNTSFTPKDMLDQILISVMSNNRIEIQFKDICLSKINVEIYDVRGKMIKQYNAIKVQNNKATLDLPANLKGVFILRLKSGAVKISKKVVLR